MSLESYTSTISHEFRTPLSTSLMFIENMLDGVTDPEHLSALNLITSQLNLLLCLVNDVLDIKLIAQGKYHAKMIDFNPMDTLQFIQDMFTP